MLNDKITDVSDNSGNEVNKIVNDISDNEFNKTVNDISSNYSSHVLLLFVP